jgi:hypothetical protein
LSAQTQTVPQKDQPGKPKAQAIFAGDYLYLALDNLYRTYFKRVIPVSRTLEQVAPESRGGNPEGQYPNPRANLNHRRSQEIRTPDW